METSIYTQPEFQLGTEITYILQTQRFEEIVLVSAFVGLSTILRLRDDLMAQVAGGCNLRLVVGIDLGGTSLDVLQELLGWQCEVFVCHNRLPRSTFHPKMYLFKGLEDASLFIGSNNLTDGGFYTNYELTTRHDFQFPADQRDFEVLTEAVSSFIEPSGDVVRPLSADLISSLIAHRLLPSEAEARRRHDGLYEPPAVGPDAPPHPFGSVSIPLPFPPPLTGFGLRALAPPYVMPFPATSSAPYPTGDIIWSKVLPASDALQVRPGSKHVGGVRLTQARSKDVLGAPIDHTSYFRQLFDHYRWEAETGRDRQPDQEHCYVPMRIIILGQDFGVKSLEISYKPSGEAGQRNQTTILRWGKDLTPFVKANDLTGRTLNLYKTEDPAALFLIEIV